jgi:hypothetical protein
MVCAKAPEVELSSVVKMIVKCAEKPEDSRRENLIKEFERSGFEFKNKKSDTLITTIMMSITGNRDSLIKINSLAKIRIFCRGNVLSKISISPQNISPALANFDFGKYAKENGIYVDLFKCGSENAGDQSIYAYRNSSDKKGAYFFSNEMSCGSHGCEVKVKAYFDNETLEKDNDLTKCK